MKSIVFLGNCQANSVRAAYQRFVAPSTGDLVRYIASYSKPSQDDVDALSRADIVVQLVADCESNGGLESAPTRAKKYCIPFVAAGWLWPNHGTPHPRRADARFNVAEMADCADAFLNRAILEGMPPEDAAQRYLDLRPKDFRGLDRRYELMLEKQRSRDRIAGFRTAELIEAKFRDENTFLTPFHPALRVARYIVLSLFEDMGVAGDDIVRTERFMCDSFYPRLEVPIHPAVAEHFGLRFVTPGHRYQWFSVGPITFFEYAVRYMNWDINDDLERGFVNFRAGDFDLACENLSAGLDSSPESAAGFITLVRAHIARGDLVSAVRVANLGVARIPTDAALRSVCAVALARSGCHADAIPHYGAAIALNPGVIQTFIDFSFSLWRLGKFAQAEEIARQGLEIEPWNAHLKERIVRIRRDIATAR